MRMIPLVSILVFGLVFVCFGATACSVKADFTGTLYHCGDADACPTDYVCLQTYCVPDVPNDAGTDASTVGCAGGDLSLGSEHSCTLRADGGVWCWGRNDYGQVGDGSLVDQTRPVQVMGLGAAKQVSAGSLHTCALEVADGSIWCWGHNAFGQLGDGSTSDSRVPLQLAGISGALGVAAADQHTCAVLGDHTVSCWGYNGLGQIGDNTVLDRHAPVAVPGLTNVTAVSAGGNNSCALESDGTAWCWGENDYGSAGTGDQSGNNVMVPTNIGLAGVAGISVGYYFACAFTTAGQVSCWGDNGWGELGNGGYNELYSPGPVAVPAKVVAVTSGWEHACARDDQQRLWCWGNNESNQLGDGRGGEHTTPILAFSGVEAAAAGSQHTCIQRSGSLSCFGDNLRGELGFGQEAVALVPTVSPKLAGLTKLAGGNGFACGVASNGTVACWGNNAEGQLGDATFLPHSLPAPSFGLTNVTALSAGYYHACALDTAGTVSCWGYNNYGELGDGTMSNGRPIAAPVLGLGGPASQVAAGWYHTCAIVAGNVKCWGRGSNNALGNNATGNYPMPVPALGVSNVKQIAAGQGHTCALKMDGTVWCWGVNNYGQLGNNTNMPVPMGPVQVMGLGGGVQEIGSLGDFTCARSGGSVACWGQAFSGHLGNGQNTPYVAVPQPVLNINTATKLTVGPDHACVLRADRTLACWGAGSSGQIGDNTSFDHLVESPVNATEITSAAVGSQFSCATHANGEVLCWGDDRQGQLGDGADITTSTTVRDVALTCP